MKDHNFDLVHGLTKKAEAVNVYEQYIKDSGTCPKCQDLWRQIKQDDNRHQDMLVQELKRHAQENRLD